MSRGRFRIFTSRPPEVGDLRTFATDFSASLSARFEPLDPPFRTWTGEAPKRLGSFRGSPGPKLLRDDRSVNRNTNSFGPPSELANSASPRRRLETRNVAVAHTPWPLLTKCCCGPHAVHDYGRLGVAFSSSEFLTLRTRRRGRRTGDRRPEEEKFQATDHARRRPRRTIIYPDAFETRRAATAEKGEGGDCLMVLNLWAGFGGEGGAKRQRSFL